MKDIPKTQKFLDYFFIFKQRTVFWYKNVIEFLNHNLFEFLVGVSLFFFICGLILEKSLVGALFTFFGAVLILYLSYVLLTSWYCEV